MSVKSRVLGLFEQNRGVYLSGEKIANQLSVSRAAVWKAVEGLRADGYQITAVTNRGYALSPDTDILSAQSVGKFLLPEFRNLRIGVYEEVSSTNQVAKELAQAGSPEGQVVIAERQTAGRGRNGRSFYSPPGTGLYLSVLLRPELTLSESLLLTTAAAVAVAEAIEALSGKRADIKWVNDVFVAGKKVCGILTEASMSLENGGVEYAVLGIGVNVFPPSQGFPEGLEKTASYVFPAANADTRSRLAAEILNRFLRIYSSLHPKNILPSYRRHLSCLGKTVTVLKDNQSRKAVALDIDERFRLLVRYEDGRQEALSSGEIRILI